MDFQRELEHDQSQKLLPNNDINILHYYIIATVDFALSSHLIE
jgi:hypothetical protein